MSYGELTMDPLPATPSHSMNFESAGHWMQIAFSSMSTSDASIRMRAVVSLYELGWP